MLKFSCVEPDTRKELKCALHWVTNSNSHKWSQTVTLGHKWSQTVTLGHTLDNT
jgi:hypothetical protein